MKLFDRACTAIVGDKRITGLRMAFKVVKTDKRDPNPFELVLTNLSQDTRNALQPKGLKVVLEAGYVEAPRVLFVGDVRQVQHTRKGADWETKLTAGDGEAAIRDAHISESYSPGTSVGKVVEGVAGKLGVAMGNVKDKVLSGDLNGAFDSFTNGLTLHGPVAPELDRLLAPTGHEWSIQDGKLQILKSNEVTKEPAVVLGSASGLIGSPEFGEKDTLKVKSLLQPDLRPGRQVQLASVAVSGLFRCKTVTHSGDTHGQDWYSECELVRT